jgi:hypothetical protein
VPLSRLEQSQLAVLQSVESDSSPHGAGNGVDSMQEDEEETAMGIRRVALADEAPALGLELASDGNVFVGEIGDDDDDDDDDDVPLALRGHALSKDVDEEDVPLAVRRASMWMSKPTAAGMQELEEENQDDDDDDDRPLGMSVAGGHSTGPVVHDYLLQQQQQQQQYQQQQYQHQHMYNLQQQQQQMAFQIAMMQQSQQYGYAESMMGGGSNTGAAVDRWRRGVEG